MSKMNLSRTRWGIGLNYFSVLFTLVLFEIVEKSNSDLDKYFQLSMILTWGALSGLVFWIVTFYKIYWKTKWWKYVHQPYEQLDEREKQAVGIAIKKAYSYFTVIVLSLILLMSVLKWYPDFVLLWTLIYLAHILPASILKWQGYNI